MLLEVFPLLPIVGYCHHQVGSKDKGTSYRMEIPSRCWMQANLLLVTKLLKYYQMGYRTRKSANTRLEIKQELGWELH